MCKKETFFKLVRCQKREREKQRDRREVGRVRAVLLSLAEETFFKRRGKDCVSTAPKAQLNIGESISVEEKTQEVVHEHIQEQWRQ